jgi:hypothetical protein
MCEKECMQEEAGGRVLFLASESGIEAVVFIQLK